MHKSTIVIFFLLFHTSFGMASPLMQIDSLHAQLLVTSNEEKANTLLSLSEAYRTIMFNDCISYGVEALELANKLDNKNLAANILKSLGISSYYSGNMDIALDYYLQSLEIYKQIDNKKGQANCLNNIGLIYEEWADFDKATDYYTKSYNIEAKLKNSEGMAISLIQIGNISYYSNSFQQALDNYYQALLIFTDINDLDGIAYSYNSIGIIYGEWNKFEKALEYYQKAKDLYNKTNNKRALSQVLTNMGKVYNFELKDYKQALQLYNEALKIRHSLDDMVGIALLNNNLGTLFANMEDNEKALQYFEISLNIYSESGASTGVVMVNYNIGEVYQKIERTKIAVSYFQKSLKMALQNGQVDFINSNYEALIHCYAKLGDYPKFENYFRLFSIGKDTLINKLHELEMKDIEIKYKVEESIRESELLQAENEKQVIEIKKYKLLLTGIAGIVILVLLIYILFIRIKKP